jgi:hypothetical protein
VTTFSRPSNKLEWKANQYAVGKLLDSMIDSLTPKERSGIYKLALFHARHYAGESPTGHKSIGRYLVTLANGIDKESL